MFGLGGPELIVIFLIALVLFGPRKLPELCRTIGRGVNELRRASDEMRQQLNIDDDLRL